MQQYEVRAPDGWRLAVHWRPAIGRRRGAALLLHAMMVDARTLDRGPSGGLATTLCQAGFDVHIADLRGHGASGPRVGDGGSWTYDDLVFRDVPSLLDAVRERSAGPTWIVGHSLGGHVALASAAVGAHTVPPDGHVLLAANVWMPSLEHSRRVRLRKHLTMVGFRTMVRAVGHYPTRRLGVGPTDEAGPYVEDLARFWFEDAWTSRDGRFDYGSNLPSVTGRVLAVVGARDHLYAHEHGARAFVGRLGPGRSTFWHVQRGHYGVPTAPDHMGLVTDPANRPLWQAVARWMEP